MSAAPIDAAERIRALDPRTSFIVQAPAGSGKTELLTRRVLTLLADVDEPEQVLAITFTRKAAAEMRHRVVSTLARAASGEAPANDYEAEGLSLARTVLARDEARGWGLLEDPGRLSMRTIDSLATALAHRLPVVSALGSAIRTVDDPRALHVEAAERFLDEHLASIERVSLQRDNRLEQVRDLLADLLAVRDQWQGYVQEDLGDERLRALLQSMLDDVARGRLEALRAAAPPELAERLAEPLGHAAELILARGDATGEAPDEGQSRIVACAARAGGWPAADPDALEDWQALADFLLTGGGTPRKRLDKSTGFPAQGEAKLLGTTKEALAAHKDAMKGPLEALAREDAFVAGLDEARGLGGLVYGDDDWALLGQLAGGLRVLLGELQLVFAARREVDFIEISARARRALGDEEHPTDLALAMDLRVRHLLVDEFQDTSHGQYALFERLVAGWEEGDGRTFFAVGDPMQSIYRFREGDVGLFLKSIDEGIGTVKLHYLRLAVNFRSVPSVIDWINEGFARAFPVRHERDIGAVTYEPSHAHLAGDGAVQLHALARGEDDGRARREGEHVARLVAEALDEDPNQSIGVLVRARGHATEVVRALHEREIPFRAVELERLGERPVVHDLVALANALCFPHDRVSWLALLRGPLCGLALADLHALVESGEQRPPIDLVQEPARLDALSADGRARVARFVAVVAPAAARAPRESVVPWLEAVWLQLGGPAACADAADLEAADRCVARLAELERDGVLRRRRTVDAAMERLFAGDAGDASVRVQLMTLHKSKGLEFDTVILPALGRSGQSDRARLMEWFRTEGDDGGPRLLLAPIDPSGAPPTHRNPVGKLLKGFRDRASEAERLRLFYVACTRARRRLHLVATLGADEEGRPKAPPAGSLLAPLWPTLGASCRFVDGGAGGAGTREVAASDRAGDVPVESFETVSSESPETLPRDTSSGEPRRAPPFVRPVAGWTLPDASRFTWSVRPPEGPAAVTVDYDWQGTTARDVGTVVHRVLQRLAETPAAARRPPDSEAIARIARELRTLGVTEALLDEAVGQVVEAVRNTLAHERGRWLLDERHDEARSEWALSVPELVDGRYAGVRRVIVDRSFVDADGVRWVVDYKTGSHEGGDVEAFLDRELERYAEQLDGYAEVLARIDPRPLRLGLWFPLVRGWRERVR